MLEKFRKDIIGEFLKESGSIQMDCGIYTDMKYPKLLPMMKFHTEKFEVPDFGNLFIMRTDAMGKMHLMTSSFMPNKGKAVPYLLIDLMSMGKKRVAFVEYYNCTGRKLPSEKLEEAAARYKEIEDYVEKPAWYVERRMKGSLIKAGRADQEALLLEMIRSSIQAYAEMIQEAETDPGCLKGLAAFRDEMLQKGNPSGATLTKVLGREGAETFMRNMVMPL